MLMRTIEAFNQAIPNIKLVLVLPQEHVYLWKDLKKKFNFEIEHTVVTGGETRFNSVKNGLSSIDEEEGFVAIHDGVRPLVTKELIKRVFEAAESKGNAIPVIDVNDSLRKVDGQKNTQVNRNEFKIVQTPQCFELGSLRKAFNQSYSKSFTDEASVIEAMGEAIVLMQGDTNNIKITTPSDLLVAESYFKSELV